MRLAVAPKIALRKVRSRTDKNQSQILAAQRVVTHHPALIGGRSLLIQILVGRCVDCEERLESLALDKTPKRVALSLIRLPGWAREADGTVRIPPLTHELLSGSTSAPRAISPHSR